jgi:hypothetical protein
VKHCCAFLACNSWRVFVATSQVEKGRLYSLLRLIPQRQMTTRSTTASAAAWPRAVRLDELPAEVPAEAYCWALLQE